MSCNSLVEQTFKYHTSINSNGLLTLSGLLTLVYTRQFFATVETPKFISEGICMFF